MKRLITCSDGTWNKPGEKDKGVVVETNVQKIFHFINETGTDKIKQLKLYDKGVGTGNLVDKMEGGLTGKGIDDNIKDVYKFLAKNYEEGDEIYLFGFSRGAYTARSVAGLIRNCGILKNEYLNKVDEAYELYRKRDETSAPNSEKMIAYKQKYSFEPRIKFIGVWDTVGSLGIPLSWFHELNNERYKFHDEKLSSRVDFAYHALSIDERRKLFQPTLWEVSENLNAETPNKQVMEQRWFAGVHSNIGGGYADCGLSDLTLEWMVNKAADIGLSFNTEALKCIACNYKAQINNSYTFLYWLWLPIWRKISYGEDNQVIDESVWKKYNDDSSYRPANLKGLNSNLTSPLSISRA